MRNNFLNIKKFVILLVAVLFSAFLFQQGTFLSVYAQQTQIDVDINYKNQVENLAQNVGFSNEFSSFYVPGQQVTLYNFVSVIRFQGEDDILDDIHPTLNKTHLEVLNEMFNSQDNYSVNKYYKTVSNNMLNLVTVFVTQGQSLEISKPRNTYGEKSINGGVGYDKNAKILGMLPEQYALEYEMLGQIYNNAITTTINTATYRGVSDYNNDGLIDSLSIIRLPDPNEGTGNEVQIGWSDLLWPHASQVQMSLVETYGPSAIWLGYTINPDHFKYTYSSKTYRAGNYMLSDVNFGSISPVSHLPSNTTFAHELGHVLGWPDYYVYNSAEFGETDPQSNNAVGEWEVMAGSYYDLPQYPTSYSRNLQGWLGNNGVVEITENGTYTLKQVNYEEVFGVPLTERTFAYKITNPAKPNQSIWFEYRKQEGNSFEKNSLDLESGLLVYRVDEGFGSFEIFGFGTNMLKSAGNFAAAPYNLYIFRNDISNASDSTELKKAPLNLQNNSMGDNETYSIDGETYTATKLTWQNYDGDTNTPQNEIPHRLVNYPVSGITVRVVSINEQTGELTFEIYYDEFNQIVTANDFGDYNLYLKLLELAGKTVGDDLFANDLQNFGTLDLQNLSLTSILGLELMRFDNLQSVNLNNNNLNNITELNNFLDQNPNVVISLIKNKFNLTTLDSNSLLNTHYIWGIQLNLYDDNFFKFNPTTPHQIVYYWQSFYNTYYQMMLNGENLASSLNLQYYIFDDYGKYEFDFVSNSPLFTGQQKVQTTIIRVTLPNLQIQRNSPFPSLIVEGVALDELNITKTNVNTTIISQNNAVSWTISPKNKPSVILPLNDYYDVVDTQAPVITLESQTPLEAVYGEILVLPQTEIYLTDNGESVDYNFIANPSLQDVSFWSKNYYKYENGVYQKLSTDLEMQLTGEYAIGYYAVDDYGNMSPVIYRSVVITSRVIDQSEFKSQDLYDAILNLTGKTKVYEDSLYSQTYIDLANLNISSVDGLELLSYQEGTIIDLSNNKINSQSIDVIANLLSNPNIAFINLILNNLIPSQQQPIEPNPKYLLGIQGITKEVYLRALPQMSRVNFYNHNDYQTHFALSSALSLVAGTNYIETLGTHTFDFVSLGVLKNVSKVVKFGNLYETATLLELDVPYNLDVYDLFSIEGIEENDVDLQYKINGQPVLPDDGFNKPLGTYSIEIDVFCNGEKLKTLSTIIIVADKTKPTVVLNGSENVYLLVGQQYFENDVDFEDNYDSSPQRRIIGQVNSNVAGTYVVTYEVEDQSGNVQSVSRTVRVGNVVAKSNFKVDVFNVISVVNMFDFVTFSIEDFNYTVTSSYNELVLGNYQVGITLTHKQDQSLVLQRENVIRVVDRQSPLIQLIGSQVVYTYVGTQYLDAGARVDDNYDAPKEISTSSYLNTNLVGTYVLTYETQDASGNVANSVTRTVNVIYKPFNSLAVSLISTASSLYVGNSVRFQANISNYDASQYNHNATFIWFVDGVEVRRGQDINFQTTFSEMGTHEIEVKVVNANTDGTSSITNGQIFQVQIDEGEFVQTYGIPIIVATSGLIILAVIYSLVARKRRKFYF